MKTKALLAALAAAAWAGNAAASVIATNSATSVSNGLVVVDYLVDGELDSPAGHIMQVVATDPSTGREYYKAYPGTKYCLAGAHCVVWNFTNEVSAANPDDAAFRVEFVTNAPAYSVVELSGGTNAVCFPVGYLEDVPDGGWTFEHKTSKLVMRRCEAGEFKMGGWSNEWAWVCNRYGYGPWERFEDDFCEDPLTLISALIDCFDQNGWPESMHALYEEMEILSYYQYDGGGRPDLECLLWEYGWPNNYGLVIEAGDFMCRTPRYYVTLTRPFYCGVFEFTEEQYKYVMGNYRDRPEWGLKYSQNPDDPLRFISFGGVRGEDSGQKWPIDKNVDEDSLMGVIREKTR